MLPDLKHQIEMERQKRDHALRHLEYSIGSLGDQISSQIQNCPTEMLKSIVGSNPWMPLAALGAGALLGRMLSGGRGGDDKPSRVVVEIQNAGGTVTAPVEPVARNPMDLVLQALAAYGTLQRAMQENAQGPLEKAMDPSSDRMNEDKNSCSEKI